MSLVLLHVQLGCSTSHRLRQLLRSDSSVRLAASTARLPQLRFELLAGFFHWLHGFCRQLQAQHRSFELAQPASACGVDFFNQAAASTASSGELQLLQLPLLRHPASSSAACSSCIAFGPIPLNFQIRIRIELHLKHQSRQRSASRSR